MGWKFSRVLGVAVFALVLISLISYSNADITASAGKSWSRLEAGEDALFPIDRDDIALTEIKFTLENMTENVDIELNVLTESDTLIEAFAPDEVYQYIRIIPTNIQAANLERATIRFRVEKTWISSNDINRENISLYRYETSWSELDTSLIREDDNHQYYQAPVEKFSLYAVSGEKAPAELLCSSGEAKCTANDLYHCSEDRTAWELLESCEYGCDGGACRLGPFCPECPEKGKVCSQGEQKCSRETVWQCTSDGSGWNMIKRCPGGCFLCGEVGNTSLLHTVILICVVVIGILVVIMIALIAYMKLHK